MTEQEFKKLCNSEVPEELRSTVDDGIAQYIPIGKLENILDLLQWSTKNFQYSMFKNEYGDLCIGASLELSIQYDFGSNNFIDRTFVGACNFSLSSIQPNQHFLATAKSECIKNAASDIGKYFGRGLNDGIVPSQKKPEKKTVKFKPDSKILKQFKDAMASKDEATINLLSNMYEFTQSDLDA